MLSRFVALSVSLTRKALLLQYKNLLGMVQAATQGKGQSLWSLHYVK